MLYTAALSFMKLFMLLCGASSINSNMSQFLPWQLSTLLTRFKSCQYQSLIGTVFLPRFHKHRQKISVHSI